MTGLYMIIESSVHFWVIAIYLKQFTAWESISKAKMIAE